MNFPHRDGLEKAYDEINRWRALYESKAQLPEFDDIWVLSPPTLERKYWQVDDSFQRIFYTTSSRIKEIQGTVEDLK